MYTVVFLTAFWSIACAVQVYLQRSINKRSPAIAINLISLILGLSSMLATVVCVFFMKNPSPIEEPDYDLSIITRDEDQKKLLHSDAVHYNQGHVEDEEVVLDETVD
jgi:stress response protein SCP2